MTSSNRVRLSSVRESQVGVTPASPRMRIKNFSTSGLTFTPEYLDPDTIRDDRMSPAPTLVFSSSGGPVTAQFRYPTPNSPESTDIVSALGAEWVETNSRDNDGTADSVISDVAVTGVVTVTTGTSFVARQLVRMSGFTNAANNGLKICTTGSATVPAFSAGLVAEAAPPGTARIKVVGLQGTAGDITATATGLGSTALNFTLFGLQVGQWINIGGATAITQFATASDRGFARITAITATALTLDNLPAGWSVDAGTGKTISIWFGDTIKNGQSIIPQTLEESFLGQSPPSHISYTGQVVDTYDLDLKSKTNAMVSVGYVGISAVAGTTALDTTYDPAILNEPMATNANVARVSEGGAALGTPNCAKSLTLSIKNNLRQRDCLNSGTPVSIVNGACDVTGSYSGYFGDLTLMNKFLAGTLTSISAAILKNNQAVVFDVPAATYNGGATPQVSGENTDVMQELQFMASYDAMTGAQIQINRFEYLEN